MIRIHLASPGFTATFAAVLLAVLLLAVSGCASTPANSLAGHQENIVRRLTAQCYRQLEGERVVYGGMPVYLACRRWADRQMQVTVAGAAFH
jgi:hypothetical protein